MDESQAREDHGEAAPLVLDAVPVPVIRYDRSLRCNLVNRAAVKASGRPTEDWIGRTNAELTGDPEVAAARDASLRQVFESRRTAIVDIPLASTTAKRALRTTVSPQFDESGEVAHVIVVATDITDLATGHEDLVEREQLLRILLDLTADTIVRFDRDLRYDYVNDRVVEVQGRPREEWIGRTQAELGFPPDDVKVREARIRAVFESGEPSTYLDQIDNLQGSRWYESQLFPQRNASGEVAHVVVIARDVTDRKLAEDELTRAALHDPLTGLANRVALLEEIHRALEASARSGAATGVLLVDLDHFKYVNDSLGHAVGDELLCRAAERLRACVRAGDLVARHGGDEFVVVMRDLHTSTDAVRLAERIVEEFRRPLLTGDADLSTTASIGISLGGSKASDASADDLLREADTAMYVAKEGGRDRFSLFDEQLQAAVDERLSLENELRGALARGELALWFQPEVDLATGQLRAAEALLRWHHPSGALYPASRFIDVAEDTGLIVEIGTWVLHEACRHAARWAGRDITVRVNLAPRQLDDPQLLEKLDSAAGVAGLPLDRLCVEITETALLHDTATVQHNLAGLSERGVAIAIDDFGTGYASLTYLRRYHVDLIKIDRSFVTNILTSERDRRLTAAVVALAHQLGMTVTAEGVEDAEQAALLWELGCRGGQGYLYRPAVPPEEIDLLLSALSRADRPPTTTRSR